MATLAGQTIASSYEQLLSLPNGGGNGANLVAITDGDAGTTFCISMTDASTGKAILAVDGSHANGTELQIDNSATDGDAFLSFQLGGTSKFTMGVDDGDSDKFKIGTTAIGTGTMFALDTNSRISLSNNNVSGATNNTIFGKLSGDDLVSGGAYNCLFGENSGHAITTGVANTAVGFEALMTEDEKNDSTAIGYQALKVQNGDQARMANCAVGYIAGTAITTGAKNTMVGAFAGWNAEVVSNTVCIGYNAGGGDMTADANGSVAIGFSALGALTSGVQNTAVGYQSQDANNTGNWNTTVGFDSGGALVAGSNSNTAIGAGALSAGNDEDTDNNTCVGSASGDVITNGHTNTIIGADSDPSGAGGTNQTTLGYGVTGTGNNEVAIGNTSVSAIKAQVTSITAYSSDERTKKDVKDYNINGLDFIKDLSLKTYIYKNPADYPNEIRNSMYDDPNLKPDDPTETQVGFIAQEVEEALKKHNISNVETYAPTQESGIKTLTYGNLIFPLISAVQELSTKVTELESKLK